MSLGAIRRAGWDELVRLLDKAHYIRYNFSTATKLLHVSKGLKERFGPLTNLLAESRTPAEPSKRLQEFKYIGPTTARIFPREVRPIWYPPGVDVTGRCPLDHDELRVAAPCRCPLVSITIGSLRQRWACSPPAQIYPVRRTRTARELESEAAATPPPRPRNPLLPCGEAMAMLARRSLRPRKARLDVPFHENLEEDVAERLTELLGHYPFRLFFRGAILHPEGFAPEETTQYLKRAQLSAYAGSLAKLGLAKRISRGRYRLLGAAKSFGGTLEWYVARELRRRFGFDVAAGVRFHARGVGGDLDVVAAAEGKLAYFELKSSPPKNLEMHEVVAFFDRVCLLRPDVTLFVADTAPRLSDKILPMLVLELEHRRGGTQVIPRRVERELWALTSHLYAVNGKTDLMANIGRAVAEGLLALSPQL